MLYLCDGPANNVSAAPAILPIGIPAADVDYVNAHATSTPAAMPGFTQIRAQGFGQGYLRFRSCSYAGNL